MKKFLPPPKFEDVKEAAALFGFNVEIKFPNEGLAGVTKFYRYDSYGEDKKAPWIVERECLNIGGVLPQYHKLSELQFIREKIGEERTLLIGQQIVQPNE